MNFDFVPLLFSYNISSIIGIGKIIRSLVIYHALFEYNNATFTTFYSLAAYKYTFVFIILS